MVFYGPPGTGKTFVAQRLAEALTPTDEQRMLVQFHPSTSYEDFFEGYRPITGADDSIVYKLIDGPLKIMAERAANDPSNDHTCSSLMRSTGPTSPRCSEVLLLDAAVGSGPCTDLTSHSPCSQSLDHRHHEHR